MVLKLPYLKKKVEGTRFQSLLSFSDPFHHLLFIELSVHFLLNELNKYLSFWESNWLLDFLAG